MKKKVLLSSIMTIVLCVSIIAGSTFALFTSSDELNVSVTAGKVNLTAVYDTASMLTWSLNETEEDARVAINGVNYFDNGGTARFEGQYVRIERMTPGDVAKFKVIVTNNSNVNIQYRIRMESSPVQKTDDNGDPIPNEYHKNLSEALVTTAYIDGNLYALTEDKTQNETPWRFIDQNTDIEDFWVTVNFPNSSNDLSKNNPDNEFQEAVTDLWFIVEAVQANGVTFEVPKSEAEFLAANDEKGKPQGFLVGEYNGEGADIDLVTESAGLAGNATISNVTVDGSTLLNNGSVATFHAPDLFMYDLNSDGVEENVIFTLADKATVIAPVAANGETTAAVAFTRVLGDTSDTLIVDSNAVIEASGANSFAVWVQGFGSTATIVLNASIKDGESNIVLKNGANGFTFQGAWDRDYPQDKSAYVTVRMLVNSLDDMAHYKAMIDPESNFVNIEWFINGTFYTTETIERFN